MALLEVRLDAVAEIRDLIGDSVDPVKSAVVAALAGADGAGLSGLRRAAGLPGGLPGLPLLRLQQVRVDRRDTDRPHAQKDYPRRYSLPA